MRATVRLSHRDGGNSDIAAKGDFRCLSKFEFVRRGEFQDSVEFPLKSLNLAHIAKSISNPRPDNNPSPKSP